jgi:predicted transcriptional regulator of viral defense system
MLDRPDLCGGMRHILGVWERHADEWVDSIVKEVDEFSSKIVKVRAGYIFTEKLNIEKPEISRWEAYAQRGGSRKLDPFSDYVAKFSDRWMISINI